jgi:adenylate cyclase
MPLPTEPVRDAGRDAVTRLRLNLAQRIAYLLQRDPERLEQAVEVGLIRREWLERPGEEPLSTSTPVEVVERMLERQVEKRPSLLPALGLTAIQVLSAGSPDDGAEGVPTRLAVAFTDLEGFTRYNAREGDEAASQLLAEHHRTIGPIVRSRGGRVVKRLGDGLLLTFPEPEPLRVRAGVHLGEIVVSMDDVMGHVVNVAARVAESAKGGEVLVTGAVKAAVGTPRGFVFGPARRRTFKGLGESVPVSKARMV